MLSNYVDRVKIKISGMKTMQYLYGEYEGEIGRIISAQVQVLMID